MEKILDKISKLLKLSESSNIEEATAAYEKAHKLLRDYNLHIEDIKEKPEIVSEIVDEGKRERVWKSLLLNSIAEANYCSFIIAEPEKCQVFSLAYERLKNLQSFQKILTKYIETKKAVIATHCLFLTKTNKDSI